MPTTIQISDSVKKMLDKMKIIERETYNNVIEIMIEDNLQLSEQTKKDFEIARKQGESGEVFTQEEVEREFGL